MKALSILLLYSVVLFCVAAPPPEPVTCSEDGSAAAAHAAMQHINQHHDHGYKFRLNEIQSHKVEQMDDGCDIKLQLHLLETTCHQVNPTPFSDCDIREEVERAVMANCSVIMTVKSDKAGVTKYECDTQKVHTDNQMMIICPDCPSLIPLNSPEGLKSVHDAVKGFNKNTTNQNIYVLQEVGRIRTGYTMVGGVSYYADFALVESHCRMGSRIVHEACKPLGPERAHHAVCRSSYTQKNGLGSVECDVYSPTNTSALPNGEQMPSCKLPPQSPPGPPPYSAGRGKPHHALGQEPLSDDEQVSSFKFSLQGPPAPPPPYPPGQGNPPHFPGQRHPFQTFHWCTRFLTNVDQALHSICPWPLLETRPVPEPHHDTSDLFAM